MSPWQPSEVKMVTAIVLAAGSSTRMGATNKLLLHYKNKIVIQHIVESILAGGIKDIVVVTGHEADLTTSALNNYPVNFVHNPRYAAGMTSSIQQGVLASNGTGYMICLGDMVTITPNEYLSIQNFFEEKVLVDSKCICLPRHKNIPGNPVIFSAYHKAGILQNQFAEGCKNVVQSNREHIYYLDMETPHILRDFDYPDEYQDLVNGV